MINIRTVTYNMPFDFGTKELEIIKKSTSFWDEFKYSVHTQRINFPVYRVIEANRIDEISKFCTNAGIRWFGIPIEIGVTDYKKISIEKILSTYKNAFFNMICAKDGKVSDKVVGRIADQFLRNAMEDNEGLIGFRFGASNNVAPNGPFFPFTYADGNHLGFSIGLELSEEINCLCDLEYANIDEFRKAIIKNLEPQLAEIENKAEEISMATNMEFDGIDFSLAPLPKYGNSVMTILKKLGIENINDTGMLFATAFLTKILKEFAVIHKSVGFSGVMYSLLEDLEYARMNSQNGFSINNMIALSTMCGCGVDMVPIPLETSADRIRTILLEVACVSSRLHKPLGVRLLPVNDFGDGVTHFTGEKDFVTNTRIVDVHGNKIGVLSGVYEY